MELLVNQLQLTKFNLSSKVQEIWLKVNLITEIDLEADKLQPTVFLWESQRTSLNSLNKNNQFTVIWPINHSSILSKTTSATCIWSKVRPLKSDKEERCQDQEARADKEVVKEVAEEGLWAVWAADIICENSYLIFTITINFEKNI